MWNDPEKIAAMEALKDATAPLKDRPAPVLVENILGALAQRAAAKGDLEKIIETRVIRALTPIMLEMKSAFETGEAEKVAQISRGILKGLGFVISTTLHYVPPPYLATAVTMLFKSATERGFVDITTVPKEPKK